ncbi:cupredoxin domain-containing protein [Synechococcus elongatus]|uniref:cupredoxin domain-containing protein n=1 Tax=Synechococcus elongatus TaxID=32046 RepID=UPI000F7EBA0C|nr:cupredoxin domain-containing protein [Synechococcus elongatus]
MAHLSSLWKPQGLRHWLLWLAIVLWAAWCCWPRPVIAATVRQSISIDFGNAAGELRFFPSQLRLKAGQPYELALHNPSPLKHYFTAKDFSDAIWTRKVDAGGVEVKGSIRELELRPGSEAVWQFTPERPGQYDLRCRIAGHTDAGMTGQLIVE